jgi:hypothetical protein
MEGDDAPSARAAGAGELAPTYAAAPQGLTLRWSEIYRPAWDGTPAAYVEHGIVGWGRSRRLARAQDPARAFKAYLGVQHYDPARWHVAGAPRATFFLSLFLAGRTIALRTFPTLGDALAELRAFHGRLGG